MPSWIVIELGAGLSWWITGSYGGAASCSDCLHFSRSEPVARRPCCGLVVGYSAPTALTTIDVRRLVLRRGQPRRLIVGGELASRAYDFRIRYIVRNPRLDKRTGISRLKNAHQQRASVIASKQGVAANIKAGDMATLKPRGSVLSHAVPRCHSHLDKTEVKYCYHLERSESEGHELLLCRGLH